MDYPAMLTSGGIGKSAIPAHAFNLADLARIAANYIRVLAGTGGRLVLLAVYFLALANTLTLADMGNFAAASAIANMIGAFNGFGFAAIAFQAAAGRRRLLRPYYGIFLISSAATLPIGLAISMPFYFAIFKDAMPLHTFMMIMVADFFMYRLCEGLLKIRNGLGDFSHASWLSVVMTIFRATGALLFAAMGGGSLETWGTIYFVANAVTVIATFALFAPRIRVTWKGRLFIKKFRGAMLFSFSSLTFDMQTEIDKVMVFTLAGDRAAGIYAIFMRVIELAVIPARTFYVLYSRKLIRESRISVAVARNLLIEAGIFAVTFASYLVFLGVLSVKPNLLGSNVEIARQLFSVALLVPALKSMMEFHSELYFAYGKLATQAAAAIGLVSLKTALIAGVLLMTHDVPAFGFWLNWVFAIIYVLSALIVYRAVVRPRQA